MNFKALRLVYALNCRLMGCVFALALGSVVSVSAEILTVDEVKTSIRVDGHLQDWPNARMILLNKRSQAVVGKAYWKGEEDFSGRIFLAYDSRNLYLSALIRRRGQVVNSNPKISLWNGDCLELFFSTDSSRGGNRLSKGDYHIGFSPGTDCRNPQVYCFNKDREVTGGRVIARPTTEGYLLEASVPFEFFAGLDLQPGTKAGFNLSLDAGGVSGNRLVQLDYSEKASSWENPVGWPEIQWAGAVTVLIAEEPAPNLFTGSIKDGTKGSTYAGLKTLRGSVSDAEGRPLPGALVTTWPKTIQVTTDSLGMFELKGVKVYDKTLVYARADGYFSSLAPFGKGEPSKIKLWSISADRGIPLASTAYGQAVRLPIEKEAPGQEGALVNHTKWILRSTGTEGIGKNREAWISLLEAFLAKANGLGAVPLVEVPRNNPELAADWVRYCNLQKGYGVKFWAVGGELELGKAETGGLDVCINDFRSAYNAMKKVDPSIVVLGPEWTSGIGAGSGDWLAPFLRFNGDIVNMVSVHRYAALKAADCSLRVVEDSQRGERAFLRSLKDKISENTDVSVPLAVTGAALCPESGTSAEKEEAGPGSFAPILWMAEEGSVAFQEGVGMNLFSPRGNSPTPLEDRQTQILLRFLSGMKGVFLEPQVQVKQSALSAYASQDPQTRDVTLLMLNKGDRYKRVRVSLDGKEADIAVDAGVGSQYDYELPSFSISLLRLKADRSNGESLCYSKKMADEDKEPESSVMKAW